MAKKTDDLCMFCGGNPCLCDGGRTKKRAKKSAAPTLPELKPSPSPTSSSVESDSDMEDVFGEIPTQVKPKFKSKSHSADRDLSYLSALRTIRPLLSSRSQREVDKELKRIYPQDIDRRIAKWKERRP